MLGRSLLLLAACLATASAGAQIRVVELAVETRSDSIVLPSGPGGTLVVMPCAGCRPLSFIAGPRAGFFIGQKAVQLEELRRHLESRRHMNVVVLYERKSGELTRLIAAPR